MLAYDRDSSLWDAARLLSVGEEGYAFRHSVGARVRALPEFTQAPVEHDRAQKNRRSSAPQRRRRDSRSSRCNASAPDRDLAHRLIALQLGDHVAHAHARPAVAPARAGGGTSAARGSTSRCARARAGSGDPLIEQIRRRRGRPGDRLRHALFGERRRPRGSSAVSSRQRHAARGVLQIALAFRAGVRLRARRLRDAPPAGDRLRARLAVHHEHASRRAALGDDLASAPRSVGVAAERRSSRSVAAPGVARGRGRCAAVRRGGGRRATGGGGREGGGHGGLLAGLGRAPARAALRGGSPPCRSRSGAVKPRRSAADRGEGVLREPLGGLGNLDFAPPPSRRSWRENARRRSATGGPATADAGGEPRRVLPESGRWIARCGEL